MTTDFNEIQDLETDTEFESEMDRLIYQPNARRIDQFHNTLTAAIVDATKVMPKKSFQPKLALAVRGHQSSPPTTLCMASSMLPKGESSLE